MSTSAPDNSSWDELQQHLDASFMQSESWEIFQRALGRKVNKLHTEKWSCLLIEQRSSLGAPYLFAPYGPTLSDKDELSAALAEITDYGRRLGAHWVRLEPCLGMDRDSDIEEVISRSKVKVVKAHKQINPLLTRLLDLTPTLSEILSSLSATNRSIVRKHQSQPIITFKTSSNSDDIATFIKMIDVVADRNKVYFHSADYFRQQAKTLMPTGAMWLEFALQDNQPIACIVMHSFNKIATYTYAASFPEARATNATALLLWQAISNAKEAGMTHLDLFGVAPEDADPSHPWYGFSIFKQKFGGRVVRRGQTIDMPIRHASYNIYRVSVKIRNLF